MNPAHPGVTVAMLKAGDFNPTRAGVIIDTLQTWSHL